MYQYETKKTREPVVQRYEIIDKRKISDDYSLQMIDSHFFYAKQGLFKSDDLAGRPFHLRREPAHVLSRPFPRARDRCPALSCTPLPLDLQDWVNYSGHVRRRERAQSASLRNAARMAADWNGSGGQACILVFLLRRT